MRSDEVHHRGLKGKVLQLANIVSLDRYTHDEKLTPELLRLMDEERRLAYHTKFLRQVVQSGPVVEVRWKIEEVPLRRLRVRSTKSDR